MVISSHKNIIFFAGLVGIPSLFLKKLNSPTPRGEGGGIRPDNFPPVIGILTKMFFLLKLRKTRSLEERGYRVFFSKNIFVLVLQKIYFSSYGNACYSMCILAQELKG